MKKRKRIAEVSGAWREHLAKIAQSRTAKKTEACRENLAKARETKMLKRLGLWPPETQK
jgi:hypothetical protein